MLNNYVLYDKIIKNDPFLLIKDKTIKLNPADRFPKLDRCR